MAGHGHGGGGSRPTDRGHKFKNGQQEVLIDAVDALVTDGRFSGASSGLSIGHVSPEAAQGGALALVEDGDTISW